MLTKYLMILWIACTMPGQLSVFGPDLRSTALTAAFGYTAVESADPGFDMRRIFLDELTPPLWWMARP